MNLKRFLTEANWFMVFYLSFVHICGFLSLAYLRQLKWGSILAFPVWYWLSGLGITGMCSCFNYLEAKLLKGGAHRLWAHRSYSAGFIVRVFLMMCNSCANQGSIFHWARDHRTHHKHSESPKGIKHPIRSAFFPTFQIHTTRKEVSSMLTLDGFS